MRRRCPTGSPSRDDPLDLADTDFAASDRIRRAESVGGPLGSGAFPDRIAQLTGRHVTVGRRVEKNALSPKSAEKRIATA